MHCSIHVLLVGGDSNGGRRVATEDLISRLKGKKALVIDEAWMISLEDFDVIITHLERANPHLQPRAKHMRSFLLIYGVRLNALPACSRHTCPSKIYFRTCACHGPCPSVASTSS